MVSVRVEIRGGACQEGRGAQASGHRAAYPGLQQGMSLGVSSQGPWQSPGDVPSSVLLLSLHLGWTEISGS